MSDAEYVRNEFGILGNRVFWKTINDFENKEIRQTKEFSFGANKDCLWKLSIINEIFDYDSKNDLTVYVSLLRCKNFKIKVTLDYKLSNVCETNKTVIDFCVGDEKKLNEGNWCMDSHFSISCEFQVENMEENFFQKEKQDLPKILKDFKSLLHKNDFNDVQFHVSETILHANKAILSSRSPYFEAMFNKDMKENLTGIVKIDDADPKIIEDMLNFIYTGQVENLKENTKELFVVANKYALDDLKVVCESALFQNITIDNVFDILKLFDLHNALNFKNEIIDFIIANKNDILSTKDFALLKECHKDIAIDILEAIVNKQQKC